MQLAKFVISLIALTTLGCATQAIQSPAQVADDAQASKSAAKQKRAKPALVAPPPAYGNRVVVVDGAHATAG